MKRKYIIILISYIVLSLVIAPIRGGYFSICNLRGIPLAHIVGSVCYFGLTLWFIYYYKAKIRPIFIISIAMIGATIIELPFHLLDFRDTLVSFPELLNRYWVILIAYVVYKVRCNLCRFLLTIIFLCSSIWFVHDGYAMWFNYIRYNSFDGHMKYKLHAPIIFHEDENRNITLSELGAEYVILDFWVSSCGVCFREFPRVQKLYEELKDRPDIKLYSVFCRDSRRGETLEWGANRLAELGYTFPTISIDISESLLREMEINAFPTVLIIDKRNTVIFRGNINLAKIYLRKLKKGDK